MDQPENVTAYPADAVKYFGLSCPSDGYIFACGSEQGNADFLGCCMNTQESFFDCRWPRTCAQKDLRAMSFKVMAGVDIPVQDCDDPMGAKLWWTCSYMETPFVGCCASNPCTAGYCPEEHLIPAKLSSDKKVRDAFLHSSQNHDDQSSTSSAPTTPTASGPGLTHTLIVNNQGPSEGGISAPTIAGIALGVTALLVIILGFAWCRIRKASKKGNVLPFPPSPNPLDRLYVGDSIPSSGGGFFGGTLMDVVRRFRSNSSPKPRASMIVRESMLPEVPDLSMLDDQTQSGRPSLNQQPLGATAELTSMQPKVNPCQIWIPGSGENTPASPTGSIRPPSYRSAGHNDAREEMNVPTAEYRYTICGALPPMADPPYRAERRRWGSPDDVI